MTELRHATFYSNFVEVTLETLLQNNLVTLHVHSLSVPRTKETVHSSNREIQLDSTSLNLSVGFYTIETICAELETQLGGSDDFGVTYDSSSNRVSIENRTTETASIDLKQLKPYFGFPQEGEISINASSTATSTQAPDLYGTRFFRLCLINSFLSDTVSSVSGNQVVVNNLDDWKSSGQIFVNGSVYEYTKESSYLEITSSVFISSGISAETPCYDVRILKLSSYPLEDRLNIYNTPSFLQFYASSSHTYFLALLQHSGLQLPSSGEATIVEYKFNHA